MAHHNRTPRSVLEAPALTPVWVYRSEPIIRGTRVVKASEPFRGNVQSDLLGSDRPGRLAARRSKRIARFIRKTLRERSEADR